MTLDEGRIRTWRFPFFSALLIALSASSRPILAVSILTRQFSLHQPRAWRVPASNDFEEVLPALYRRGEAYQGAARRLIALPWLKNGISRKGFGMPGLFNPATLRVSHISMAITRDGKVLVLIVVVLRPTKELMVEGE